MDIVIHLQATLDKNVGGKVAETLSEFYTAMFALMLKGSQANSRDKFEQVIANVRTVREAWKQVAADPAAGVLIAAQAAPPNRSPATAEFHCCSTEEAGSGVSWSA